MNNIWFKLTLCGIVLLGTHVGVQAADPVTPTPLSGGTVTGDITLGSGFVLSLDAGTNDAPAINFGTANTGIYSNNATTSIDLTFSGNRYYVANTTYMGSLNNHVFARASSQPAVYHISDSDTGLGRPGADIAALYAGGQTGLQVVEGENAAGETQFKPDACTFANLGTPADGTFCWCSDCTKATPCAGSGTGAIAKRYNGAWDCD